MIIQSTFIMETSNKSKENISMYKPSHECIGRYPSHYTYVIHTFATKINHPYKVNLPFPWILWKHLNHTLRVREKTGELSRFRWLFVRNFVGVLPGIYHVTRCQLEKSDFRSIPSMYLYHLLASVTDIIFTWYILILFLYYYKYIQINVDIVIY